jgi:hypothetical protein
MFQLRTRGCRRSANSIIVSYRLRSILIYRDADSAIGLLRAGPVGVPRPIAHKLHGGTTAANVKRLWPPRQSRGTSLGCQATCERRMRYPVTGPAHRRGQLLPWAQSSRASDQSVRRFRLRGLISPEPAGEPTRASRQCVRRSFEKVHACLHRPISSSGPEEESVRTPLFGATNESAPYQRPPRTLPRRIKWGSLLKPQLLSPYIEGAPQVEDSL